MNWVVGNLVIDSSIDQSITTITHLLDSRQIRTFASRPRRHWSLAAVRELLLHRLCPRQQGADSPGRARPRGDARERRSHPRSHLLVADRRKRLVSAGDDAVVSVQLRGPRQRLSTSIGYHVVNLSLHIVNVLLAFACDAAGDGSNGRSRSRRRRSGRCIRSRPKR